MQASQESFQGYLHGTLQAILAARISYDRNAAELLQAANDSFRATAEHLVRGNLVEYAQSVARQSHLFRKATTAILNDGALALDTEANGVLQALAGMHDMPAVPPLTPGPEHALGQASNPERFGTRFASSYAAGIIKDFGARVVMTRGQLRDVPKVSKRQIIEAKEEILALVPSHYRERVRDLLYAEGTHAVEYHGPHLTGDQLVARCVWSRPPDHGAQRHHSWGIDDDGEVWVNSRRLPPPNSGRFTSPEAFATAIEGFLKKADAYPGGMNGLLSYNALHGRAVVDIPMRDLGLGPGDTERYRPAGVRNSQSQVDWSLAREKAMEPLSTSGPPVPVRRDDPAVTSRTGGRIKFVFGEDGPRDWTLITMFA